MSARYGKACDIVVFGGTGDLAMRKLLPALFYLHRDRHLHPDTRILSLARARHEGDSYRKLVRRHVSQHVAKADFDEATWDGFAERLDYLTLDVSQRVEFARLARHLGEQPGRVRVFYLATLPDLFAPTALHLESAGLVNAEARIVLEKPLGDSLKTANQINDRIGSVFDESRVFRIDHFLGKEAVQNLLALRFGNALFEPLWRNGHIDHVQISVLETVGVENRGAYYDHAGAMRDMVQNHLLQLLCLVAMEAPVHFEPEAVRNEKLKILEALRPITGMDVQDQTVRGQYSKGKRAGEQLPAYYFEKSVDHDSNTETYVALKAEIDNWRWAGVPFYLRTGKSLAQRKSEIVIQFKSVPHRLFPGNDTPVGNRLVIRLQPDESISLSLMAKSPGRGMALQEVDLDLHFDEAFQRRRWDAYERLLLDVIQGDATLFMRRDEIEAAWRWVDPIIRGWREVYRSPKRYAAGSWGPEAADSLLERTGHVWSDER
ncbi:glucose-6-phosphate dehydrogenase [Pseudomonas sp. G11-1]|uniref:Glucose-6-phosphate 1-dehydrogenase n=1 Tax=Halopseudomonas bauzanensis TaxID=653930 RepID=A0A4U0YKY5_9GAMM|nr:MULTISPECIES: glucose-6-phosphate dehydrogenase [Halopseudomonas]MCO5787010.1 glucose-6-phosphate dehydrogenase [Pseudomonas sp. G11-1]MCO5790236.1 glucose-6-phosphate dehydrogenase [Pseudomonas sp. G11-2]TKA92902.1 glucose-6-phosphate dehydrogenase [Halopseudomonas bauzanensis]WGK61622.1 glucose-6-phosphate dehydrogenase [Halopseudomonas sp. SMJS2]